jgi:serine/threonine protein kinase
MINERSTKTFINNSSIIIAKRFIKLQTIYTNNIHNIIKVYDKLLDKESLLKILKDKTNRELLESEFKMIIKLNSHNIVRGYDLYSDGDLYFYSMEFIKNQFKEIHLKKYINDILKAFDYIHKNSFIHNDIKLNNFLFEEDRAVIIDFSKSKIVNNFYEIQNEELLLSRFLIQWINYNLKIDMLGNPEKTKEYIDKNDVDKLINMFYRKNHAI